jgi:uracil-DNA glycosylase family 4
MPRSEAGTRVLLRRLYAEYAEEPRLAHMRAGVRGVVPGRGATRPLLVFVGEAPGANEDRLGMPFIGASGQLLNEMLESVGLDRDEVFITNTVKYRPLNSNGGNRPPTEEEKLASISYLRREFALLGNPPIVVLGKHAKSAMAHIAPSGTRLGDQTLNMRLGEWTTALGTPMLPLHHPAYAIYQRANRPLMFEMFKAVLDAPQ